jgi:hypothetical protein
MRLTKPHASLPPFKGTAFFSDFQIIRMTMCHHWKSTIFAEIPYGLHLREYDNVSLWISCGLGVDNRIKMCIKKFGK